MHSHLSLFRLFAAVRLRRRICRVSFDLSDDMPTSHEPRRFVESSKWNACKIYTETAIAIDMQQGASETLKNVAK